MFMKRKFATLIICCGLFMLCLLIRLNNLDNKFTAGEFLSSRAHHNVQYIPEVDFSTNELTPSYSNNADSIQALITLRNKQQKILNLEKFGPLTQSTILITVQVHNRFSYLAKLIESLKTARDISSALVIFSHDVFSQEANQMIQEIDFCMIMQIFYPYSIQTHPLTFPGDDPKDCPRDISRSEAERINCRNHDHPDMYGHYREAKFTQMKHHWWWKLNRIFDQLRATKHLNGYLLLLEEDYYIAEDFIHVLKLMQKRSLETCADCSIISLGTYRETIDEKSFDVLDAFPWETSKHNMGMSFNKTTWSSFKKCAKHFCNYDEYNYDFSLQNVNLRCLKQKLFVSIIRGPRVFHIGECGVHHSKKDCAPDNKLKEVSGNLISAKTRHLLFPASLRKGVSHLIPPSFELIPNGGWGDDRDRRLCLNITMDIG